MKTTITADRAREILVILSGIAEGSVTKYRGPEAKVTYYIEGVVPWEHRREIGSTACAVVDGKLTVDGITSAEDTEIRRVMDRMMGRRVYSKAVAAIVSGRLH